MELLQLLLDVLVLGCPRFAAVLLVLAAALFGFCAYVFFDTAQWAGDNGRAVSSFWCWPWLLWRCSSGGFSAENSAAIPEADAPSTDSAA